MSKQYDQYLQDHKENVNKGFIWLKQNLPEVLEDMPEGTDLEYQIAFAHDLSKDAADEYSAYDAYFYGRNRSTEVVEAFNYAWLNHIHRNSHHWQHWVLMNDDPESGTIVMEMPKNFIIEMICDWWAFSWKDGDLHEIFDWWAAHTDYMKLNDLTRGIVEGILSKIFLQLTYIHNEKEIE